MDRIVEQLSKLQELSDEELSELEELCVSEFDSVQSAELSTDTVASMTQLADAVEAVRTEKSRRVTENSALQEAAAQAAARIKPAEAPAESAEEGDSAIAEASAPPPFPPPSKDDEEETGDGKKDGEIPLEEDPEKDKDDSEGKPFSTTASGEKGDGGEPIEVVAAEDENSDQPKADPNTEEKQANEPAETPPAEETPDAGEIGTGPPAEPAPAVDPVMPTYPAGTGTTASEASENTDQSQEDTVTADASPQGNGEGLAIEPPAGRQPQIKPATTVSITAGADVPGYSAGTPLKNSTEVAEALMRRLHTLRHVHGGDGEQHIVASYNQEFPSERELSANDPLENTSKIQGVTSFEAITAAAGVCLPLETRYDIPCDIGVTDRPVRDALARFGADRGGIRFFAAPVLTDYNAATGYWRTTAGTSDGASVYNTYGPDRLTATSPANLKPCLEVQCVAESEAYIEAITLCLTFNNLTTRTFPELIKRHNDLALVAHARVAENALLAQLEAGSTAISLPTQVVGAARELFNALGLAVAAYRYKHRMSNVAPLRMVVPAWVRDFVRADLTLQMPGDGIENTIGVADAKIDGWFRSRGVNVTWHLDGAAGPIIGDLDDGGAGTAVGFEWPTTLEFGLWAEGTWLYLDGGTLDIGVIRDSSLVATNQYKQFVETFEGVANVGCESYWVTATLEPTGAAAALV